MHSRGRDIWRLGLRGLSDFLRGVDELRYRGEDIVSDGGVRQEMFYRWCREYGLLIIYVGMCYVPTCVFGIFRMMVRVCIVSMRIAISINSCY